MTANPEAVQALVEGRCGDPFTLLGPHPVTLGSRTGLAIRAFLPEARSASVKRGSRLVPMERIHPDGCFEAILPAARGASAYRLVLQREDGTTATIDDPYRFSPVLGEVDLHLFNEGTHVELHGKLGAQVRKHDGVLGVSFAVWAPHATAVTVIGSFNGWDERRHPMRARESSGIWELFVPGLGPGAIYKYRIRTKQQGAASIKADPYGFAMEPPPRTASVIWDLEPYRWLDRKWMATRKQRQAPDAPLFIYEVHLGSWRRQPDGRWLTYAELAKTLIPYAQSMGFTHLELLPVTEHPFDGSWGYQTTGYFAPTARFGTPDDFRNFVDRAHQAGLGIILDWVPAHFPKDAHGLGFFDGTHLYEHADPRQGFHPDWNTMIFNLGRPEVRSFLLSNALFWLERYHIDGLRVDAVASMLYLDYSRKAGEWIPNRFGGRENLEAIDFLRSFNTLVHERHPDVLAIAEESTAWPRVSGPPSEGGLGFGLKWNMGWMHDMIAYMKEDPVHRRFHQKKLTFSLLYAYSEKFLLPLSHDEVVHGKGSLLLKMPGDAWRRFANLRALYAYMVGHPGKKLLFMGAEIGQLREWNHDRELDWELLEQEHHRDLHAFVKDLLGLYRAEPALYEEDFRPQGFQWIDFKDEEHSTVSFLRMAHDPGDRVLVVAGFTPSPQANYRIGVPEAGEYAILLDSDATRYGGSGSAGGGPFVAKAEPWHGQPFSIELTVPPLGVIFLKRGD